MEKRQKFTAEFKREAMADADVGKAGGRLIAWLTPKQPRQMCSKPLAATNRPYSTRCSWSHCQ